MKLGSLFALATCFLAACSDNPTQPEELKGHLSSDLVHNPNTLTPNESSDVLGKLVFTDTVHVFGKIKEGEKVNYAFSYTNKGSKDILIFTAKASCGCTIPEYNRDTPIKPGESGEIKVSFNSEGKKGHQRKAILVNTNGNPAMQELFIEADVY